eukprot:TRINITY_DN4628_c0_g1_i1.p1 TRINITY_DN4628_c0_g1~~TRINITY_DN4628_c0_g1_i1.p1  ORF type:complete len:344 (+),score=84.62 TRINITY_DN4628_c0_g1_i1:583-1614(+)
MYRYSALIFGVVSGIVMGMAMIKVQKLCTFKRVQIAFKHGVGIMASPLVILVMAWAIGKAINDVKTSVWIVHGLGKDLPVESMPALVFLLSGVVAFCSGTSFGTMSIMFPLVVPLVHALDPTNYEALTGTVASVLSGAVFGDHCSLVSDTTILSSTACACPVRLHFLTQVPYALTVAIISVLTGYLPVGYGLWPSWVGILIGSIVIVLFLFLFGKKLEDPADEQLARQRDISMHSIRRHHHSHSHTSRSQMHDEHEVEYEQHEEDHGHEDEQHHEPIDHHHVEIEDHEEDHSQGLMSNHGTPRTSGQIDRSEEPEVDDSDEKVFSGWAHIGDNFSSLIGKCKK